MSAPLKPLKWYRELGESKARRQAGVFLVEGERAIRQIIGGHPEAIMEIIATAEPPPTYHHYPVRRVTESQFRYIGHTRTPQGIMAVVRLPEAALSDRLPEEAGDKILLMEDIQDPGNAGTLIRTAAAFDFSGVILTESGADPFAPKCIQATAGAVLSLWLRRTARYLEMATELRQRGYSLVAAELNGDAGAEVIAGQDRLLLALGNEAAGLSPRLLEMADYRLRLPTARAKAESLNVAVCGAILMYLSSQPRGR
jgi:TrmH family RNA methyltransferase